MADYLGEVGRSGRGLAIFGLGLASVVLAALNLLVVIVAIDPKARAEIRGPLIASGLLFGCLALVCLWMLLTGR